MTPEGWGSAIQEGYVLITVWGFSIQTLFQTLNIPIEIEQVMVTSSHMMIDGSPHFFRLPRKVFNGRSLWVPQDRQNLSSSLLKTEFS